MVATIYADHDRILWFPAAASVHAHLLALVDEGRVVAVDDGGADATDDGNAPATQGAPPIDATYALT